jgi:hypothetical protein
MLYSAVRFSGKSNLRNFEVEAHFLLEVSPRRSNAASSDSRIVDAVARHVLVPLGFTENFSGQLAECG